MRVDRSADHSAMLRIAALVVTSILAAACAAQSPSASPSSATTSPTVAPVSPSPSASPPTPSPTPSATPTTEPSHAITTGRWVTAGKVSRDIQDAELVALSNGGAMLIGIENDDRGGEILRRMATEIWQPGSDAWRQTTPLPKMRSKFAAVAVDDGRVLVAGGYNEKDASYSSVQIFDPTKGTWSKTGLMTVARTHPGIALLSDGRVLVMGGYFYAPEAMSDGPTFAATPADAVLAAWTPAAATDRAALAVAPLYDVIEPPVGRALATAELFDPRTGEWARTGSMRFARSGPQVTVLVDGRVLVVGSSAGDNVRTDPRAYDTAEIYDPATGTFTSMGRLPEIDRAAIARHGVDLPSFDPTPGVSGSLVPLPDGGAVLIGHHGWWKYAGEVVRSFRLDVGDRTWREIGRAFAQTGGEAPESDTGNVSRAYAVAAALPDGSVLVAGGSATGWGPDARPPKSVQRYDSAQDVWSRLPNMPDARSETSGIRLADGSVLVVGGYVPVGDYQGAWTDTTYRFIPGT